jgi:hypothetical protein
VTFKQYYPVLAFLGPALWPPRAAQGTDLSAGWNEARIFRVIFEWEIIKAFARKFLLSRR